MGKISRLIFFSNYTFSEIIYFKRGEQKMKRKKMFLFLTVLTLMTQITNYIFACTAIIVGKKLTTDGSFIFGRNEDLEPDHNKTFVVHNRKKNKPGDVFKDETNGFTYILPSESFKYTAIPDVTPKEGVFDEAGFNEYGVIVDATVSAKANKKIQEIDPYVKDGLAESALTSVVLPYVKTAREGVMHLGNIIKTKGAAEGNTLVIADKNEVWYIEIYSGHQFVAIKYPDDKFSVFPNTFYLGTVDLKDKKNVIASENIETVAKKAGTYVSENGKIHLAKSYAPEFDDRNRSRTYSGILSLNPEAKITYTDERYDFFQSTNKKISLQDVMRTFRNRFENMGFKAELSKEDKGKEGYKYPIGNINTMESHIFQIKKNLSDKVGGIMWLSMAAPKFSPYVPYYGNINATDTSYHDTSTKYNENSFYWVADNVNDRLDKSSAEIQNKFLNKIKNYEDRKISEQAELDKKISKMSAKEAEKFATELALKNGKEAFKMMKEQENLLLIK